MKKENVHAKHKKSLAERFWKQKYLFLLLIPSLVWVILICYAPMTGLYMSFINYTPQGSGYFADMVNSQFVGLDWFKYFFSTDFTKIMRNTLATSLLTLLFSFPLPIILALCLNEVRNQKYGPFWKNRIDSSVNPKNFNRLLMTPSEERNVRKMFAAITQEIK